MRQCKEKSVVNKSIGNLEHNQNDDSSIRKTENRETLHSLMLPALIFVRLTVDFINSYNLVSKMSIKVPEVGGHHCGMGTTWMNGKPNIQGTMTWASLMTSVCELTG